ncbi:MAG: LamG-like jellyroll fold domain-containing protein [Opitutaceae bacterium]
MKTSRKRILPLAACLLAGSANAQITTDLIGHWEFENSLTETSGTHTGGLHDGVASGTVGYAAHTDAAFGQALDLDGTNGVYIQNSANTEAGYATTFDGDINNAISISFWANGAPGTWSPFVSKHGEGTEGYQVRRRGGTGEAVFTLRSTDGTDDPTASNGAATSAGWKHILVVWDGSGSGTRKIYINGVEDAAFTSNVGPSDLAAGGPGNAVDKLLAFGMRDAGAAVFQNYFTGQLDDVAIWSRALTDVEAIHLATRPLADVITSTDTDGDGLFDDDESNIHGTNPNLADTDGDGVNDYEEIQAGSDALNDNDHDGDGLMNSDETSGDANPYTGSTLGATPGDTTDWNNGDSDGDGVNDGDEVGTANSFVTNPNAGDTDGDGWSDGIELGLAVPSDPTDPSSVPPVNTNLIGHWEFEGDLTETSGAHTATPGLHDGVADGVIAYAPHTDTDFGQALVLDGTNGVYVQNSANTEAGYVPTFDDDINTANAMSISLWMNGSLGRWNPILSKNGEGSGFQFRRNNRNTAISLTLRNTSGQDDPNGANGAATANAGWQHVVAVWDGSGSGSRKVYVNGVEDTTFATNVGATDTAGTGPGDAVDSLLTFGMRDNGGFSNRFTGQIDDVAIWSRAITPAEIGLLAANPVSVVLVSTDTDGDGLFDDDETNVHGTNPSLADTDSDGVNDFDEVQAGSDALNDNDFDNDGLSNLQETTGSANPWTAGVLGTPDGDTTAWNNPDSDLDGIKDGEEVAAGVDGFVTNPNDADTDDDGFVDGAETGASLPSDPTDVNSTLVEWQRGLYGYWKFDNDLTDSGFLGADGVLLGDAVSTATYVPGQFGQAIDLNKVNNERVEVSGDENYFDAVGEDITVSVWVTAESLDDQWQGIVAKGEQSWRIARRHTSLGAAFAAGTNGDAPALNETASGSPIAGGAWHHVVGVAEFGVATRIYVDGYLVEERTDALPNVLDVANAVIIGGNPDTLRTWNGNIDDVAIWKRSLSAEEIYTIYADGNDVQYLIDNDVVPGVVPDPIVVVQSSGFDETNRFNVQVKGLVPTKSYELWVTESLDPALLEWFDVDGPITGVSTYTFGDPVDLGFFPTGFYVIVEVPTAP